MPLIWRQMFPEHAAAHRLYGLRGWLLAFYVSTAAVFLLGVYDAISGFREEVLDEVLPTPLQLGAVKAMKLVWSALLLPFLVLVPMRHRQMPVVSIVCLWASVLVGLGALIAQPPALVGMIPLPVAALACILTWYLISSERVNVTYRLRTRDA
jgi:hypothetical protein